VLKCRMYTCGQLSQIGVSVALRSSSNMPAHTKIVAFGALRTRLVLRSTQLYSVASGTVGIAKTMYRDLVGSAVIIGGHLRKFATATMTRATRAAPEAVGDCHSVGDVVLRRVAYPVGVLTDINKSSHH
jgi:hypothetical protein